VSEVADVRIHSAILKIASRCNLNCSYCYVYNHEDDSYLDRPGLMRDEVLDAALARLAEHCGNHGHSVSLLLHGGEPTLVGRARFGEIVARSREVLGPSLRRISMQTNGVLVDSAWSKLLVDLRVDVSVSIDGPRLIHDATRVDHQGRGSYDRVVAGLRHLIAAGHRPDVLCVINPAMSGLDAYREFLALGIKRFDFLFPDVTHDSKLFRYAGLGPHPVADYLVPIFDEWLDTDDPTVEIRIFQTLVALVMGGQSTSDLFGNLPLRYVIIETDGALEGLDVLRVCENRMPSTGLNVLTDAIDDLGAVQSLVTRAMADGFPLPESCRACHEVQVCGGGYPPHRYSRARGFDNPSAWCADILVLIAHIRKRIAAYGYP
jgi:uncharacterized protein